MSIRHEQFHTALNEYTRYMHHEHEYQWCITVEKVTREYEETTTKKGAKARKVVTEAVSLESESTRTWTGFFRFRDLDDMIEQIPCPDDILLPETEFSGTEVIYRRKAERTDKPPRMPALGDFKS